MKLKLKLDPQHILFVVLAVVCAGGLTYTQFFAGSAPLAASTGIARYIGALAIAGSFLTSLASLLKRSPGDNWKLLVGLLTASKPPPPTPAGGAAYRSPASAIASTETTAPKPPTMQRVGHWMGHQARINVGLLTASAVGLLGAGAIVLITGAITVACTTPAKTAAAQTLTSTAACIFNDLELGKTVEATATDCNVGPQDIFDIVALLDARIPKGPIILDAGTTTVTVTAPDAGGQ